MPRVATGTLVGPTHLEAPRLRDALTLVCAGGCGQTAVFALGATDGDVSAAVAVLSSGWDAM